MRYLHDVFKGTDLDMWDLDPTLVSAVRVSVALEYSVHMPGSRCKVYCKKALCCVEGIPLTLRWI